MGHWWRHVKDGFAEMVLEHFEDCFAARVVGGRHRDRRLLCTALLRGLLEDVHRGLLRCACRWWKTSRTALLHGSLARGRHRGLL